MADFELTMQDPPRMNERLEDLTDLIGETIKGAFDCNDDGACVLVTDTGNWIVLNAESDSCGEGPHIEVVKPAPWRKHGQTLDSYVKPRALFDAGCISHGVYAELQAQADAKDAVAKERRANLLRRELEQLEGKAPDA